MAEQLRHDRKTAVQEFAARLRELRAAAGNPSFREMSGRSRAISHTTLHEAAQGNRLPSWATTVEFAKACGADPAELRASWQQANRVVRAAESVDAPPDDLLIEPPAGAPVESAAAAVPDLRPEPATADAVPPVADAVPPVAGPPRRRLATAAVVVAAVGAGGVGGWLLRPTHDPAPAAASSTAPAYTAADCPVHKANPPLAAPRHPGDASRFVADLTLPDCSTVPRGRTLTKTWRLRNAGTVTWRGYALHRVDAGQDRDGCQTITDVPVPTTAPGALVDISVAVTTPAVPAFCFVRFKMLDGDGRLAFSGSRPVNFQLVVR